METQDKNMNCRDCGRDFVFTVGEQNFYKEKGFENEPTRCPDCRSNKKRERTMYRGGSRRLYDVVCEQCGQTTQVPFEPRQGRPVYCRDCYGKTIKR